MIYDGDFTIAEAVGGRRWTRPFEGDTASAYFDQDFMQRLDSWEPLPLDTADTLHEDAYLVSESPLQDLGLGIVRWTRRFSRVPASRVEFESYAHTVPGITPDPFLILRPITSGSNSGSVTTITTNTAHGYIAGDTVVITYSVLISGALYARNVKRAVIATPTATTFTVALIAEPVAPVYGIVYKFQPGRRPFATEVLSYLHFDYYLPGVTPGIAAVADIPLLNPTPILDQAGDRTDSYASYTNPTLADYRALVAGGTQIVVEPPSLKRWQGNIYERVTRYVVAI